MSKNSTAIEAHGALAYIEEAVCAELQRVLNTVFGSTLFMARASASPSDKEDRVWFTYDLVPAQLGSIAFGAGRATALALGHRLLEAKRRTSQHEHHALHATGHLMNQLASSVARTLSARLNAQIDCREAAENVQPPTAFQSFAVEFSNSDSASDLLCAMPPAALAALEEASGSASIAAPAAVSTPARQNLDLLLDLEMPVTISFGATRLPLSDIAKLTTGSVVELNRGIAEPVDIVVNNRPIARGEVVVVEGNFAVRISQVMSKQDRLRSLS